MQRHSVRFFGGSKFLALFILLLAGEVRAQGDGFSATGSNLLRVGAGTTENTGGEPILKRYLEEIANARLFFKDISLGLRYEMDDPSEVGRSFQGIRRRWITYRKDKLEVQGGDVTALYGRGLSVNLFESRPLNFDAWLDGASAGYEYVWSKKESDFQPSIGIHGVAGQLDFVQVQPTTQPDMHISARSINGEFGFFKKQIVLGTSFLQAFTNTLTTQVSTRQVNQPEYYVSLHSGEFDFFAQYAQNREQLTQKLGKADSASNSGSAAYGAVSYASSIFGLTIEYKNYQYYPHPDNGQYAVYFGKLPISNPPEVYKEFTYTSITRTTHAVNFNDEVGYEAEANITAIPNVTITLNGAASSRHKAYSDQVDTVNFASIEKGSTSLLPKLNDLSFFPFWEGFAEVEYDLGGLNYIKAFYHRRGDVIAYSGGDPLSADRRRSTTVGAKFQYETTPNQSILAIFEHQWMTDYARTIDDKNFLNELLTLQYSFDPLITFGGVFDFSTEYEESRHIWPQAFVSIRIGDSHTLITSYGAERGGLNCTGGICRVVPPFNGLRMSLTSQL